MEIWQDLEAWQLLAARVEGETKWQMTWTVRDNIVYVNIMRLLNERDIHCTQKQATNKLRH